MTTNNILDNMMIISECNTQLCLSKILEVSAPAISLFRKSKVPKKRIDIFLKKFPKYTREDLNRNTSSIINEDIINILTNLYAENKKPKHIDSLELSLLALKLSKRKLEKTLVFGGYKETYTNLKDDIDLSSIIVTPVGFFIGKGDLKEGFFNNENFITTIDFLNNIILIHKSIHETQNLLRHESFNTFVFSITKDIDIIYTKMMLSELS